MEQTPALKAIGRDAARLLGQFSPIILSNRAPVEPLADGRLAPGAGGLVKALTSRRARHRQVGRSSQLEHGSRPGLSDLSRADRCRGLPASLHDHQQSAALVRAPLFVEHRRGAGR